MNSSEFFRLLLLELHENPELRPYYKFLAGKTSFHFRKAYFLQRLRYAREHVGGPDSRIWDCGCGYGTTALFLALNGYRVHGTTLQFFIDQLPARIEYWSRYGDVSSFTYAYENLFDSPPAPASYDVVIVQDTLHHLEPISGAMTILRDALVPQGRVVAIEENGNNVPQLLKLYLRRGNRRIVPMYDERLGKEVALGNENIRPLAEWKRIAGGCGFRIDDSSVQYIRFFPPFAFTERNAEALVLREQRLWRSSSLARERFFFGLNFIAVRTE